MQPITHYWQTINIVSILLSPLSLIVCFLIYIRRWMYHFGLLRSYKASIPIIVVGNIYIGGNGKTPFVIWLVNQLKSAGYKPGIVSRGYGAVNDDSLNMPFPRQVSLQQNHQLFSDEPLLIFQNTDCPVFIDPIRTRAVKKLEQTTDCDIIVSDDGLQHYAMQRDIEINISDARRLYGNGLCLPAGPLREGRQRLSSVDYHVFNISQFKSFNKADFDNEYEFFMDYALNTLVPIFASQSDTIKLENFHGKTVHAVAGIGEPDNFFRLLKNYGLTIIEHPFADHYQYQADDLIFTESYPIIMTEKDAVKCQSLALNENKNEYWFLPIQARLDDGLIDSIINKLNIIEANKRNDNGQ